MRIPPPTHEARGPRERPTAEVGAARRAAALTHAHRVGRERGLEERALGHAVTFQLGRDRARRA